MLGPVVVLLDQLDLHRSGLRGGDLGLLLDLLAAVGDRVVIRGSTTNGPMPNTEAQRPAAATTSSTTKPSWKNRYSPSGHACSYSR